MKAVAGWPWMPSRLCVKAGAAEGDSSHPRRGDGRPLSYAALFSGETIGDDLALASAAPTIHLAGRAREKVGSRTREVSLAPEDLSLRSDARRLDAYLELADHAELGAGWAMRALIEALLNDEELQSDLLLEYLWGPNEARPWRLRDRPSLELLARAGPLFGARSLADFERVLERIFEGHAVVRLRSGGREGCVGELAASLRGATREGTRGLRPRPPLVAPAPLAAPWVEVSLSREAHQLAFEHGFELGHPDPEDTWEIELGWGLVEAIGRGFFPPHVHIFASESRSEG